MLKISGICIMKEKEIEEIAKEEYERGYATALYDFAVDIVNNPEAIRETLDIIIAMKGENTIVQDMTYKNEQNIEDDVMVQ